jgi:hypothetical protein
MWVDGSSDLSRSNKVIGVNARLNPNNDASFSTNGAQRTLKVGETWTVADNEVTALFNRGLKSVEAQSVEAQSVEAQSVEEVPDPDAPR